jgi:soluble lytic murein transglycosylase-like protein
VPFEVFLSPNPDFDAPDTQMQSYQVQPQTQSYQIQPQTRAIVQQPSVPTTQHMLIVPERPGQDMTVFTQQIDAALAEALAHTYAGEARLKENNIIEAVREFELARTIIENDVDPALQYIQQVPKVQGGASILSQQRIQAIETQRSDLLIRINRSYDFQALYEQQRQTDRVDALRAQNSPALQPVILNRQAPVTHPFTVRPSVYQLVPADPLNLMLSQEDITRYIHTFQQRRTTFQSYLLRANQYVPIVTSILSNYGVPQELAYVALIASGFQPTIKDSSGKVGLWQLSSSVAKRYGLDVNSKRDERKDVEASTRAFARYINDLYDRFGSWGLAIMAYEMGEQNLQRAINRAGSYDIYMVRRQVGTSSRAGTFLPKLAAAIEISRQPEEYGFTSSSFYRSGTQQTHLKQSVATEMIEPPAATLY